MSDLFLMSLVKRAIEGAMAGVSDTMGLKDHANRLET